MRIHNSADVAVVLNKLIHPGGINLVGLIGTAYFLEKQIKNGITNQNEVIESFKMTISMDMEKLRKEMQMIRQELDTINQQIANLAEQSLALCRRRFSFR